MMPPNPRNWRKYAAELSCGWVSAPAGGEWMLWIACPDSSGMVRAGTKNGTSFQLWQPESHPVEVGNAAMAHQKLAYIHHNPVEAGFVAFPEQWLYSSARDYNGGKGLLEIILLDPLLV